MTLSSGYTLSAKLLRQRRNWVNLFAYREDLKYCHQIMDHEVNNRLYHSEIELQMG